MKTHRVYLVPGFFGFANVGGLGYFSHVHRILEADLKERGVRAEVHLVKSLPTASGKWAPIRICCPS